MYSTDSSPSVRPCYLEKNHGLASLKDMYSVHSVNNNSFVSRSMMSMMTMVYAAATSYISSPRSGRRFYDARFEDHHQPHFLQACFLCNKTLGNNSDIFMYKGDTPFCSDECRAEQIDIDEAKEKKSKLSSSMKVMGNKEQSKSGSPNKAQGYSFLTGAVAA